MHLQSQQTFFPRNQTEHENRGHVPKSPWHCVALSALALSHQRFLTLWLDSLLKNFCALHLSGAPQKFFQSGPALAKVGAVDIHSTTMRFWLHLRQTMNTLRLEVFQNLRHKMPPSKHCTENVQVTRRILRLKDLSNHQARPTDAVDQAIPVCFRPQLFFLLIHVSSIPFFFKQKYWTGLCDEQRASVLNLSVIPDQRWT